MYNIVLGWIPYTFTLVDSILVIYVHQICWFQISTTEIFIIGTIRSWHTQNRGNIWKCGIFCIANIIRNWIVDNVIISRNKILLANFLLQACQEYYRLTLGHFCPICVLSRTFFQNLHFFKHIMDQDCNVANVLYFEQQVKCTWA